MARMREASARYWERQFQTILVRTLTGVFQDNITNDASDMVNDIGTDSAAAITAAELISAEAVLDTKNTMGDTADGLAVLIMHSQVFLRLQKLNLIDYIPDSEGKVQFQRYLGYDIIVDDGVRKVVGANRTEYWTYLVGRGAIAWAEVSVPTPAEVERKPAQGNGMGVEILYMRRQFVMHPPGIKWTDTSVSGEFPSNADLANPLNWDRVYAERKQIPLAALVTNG